MARQTVPNTHSDPDPIARWLALVAVLIAGLVVVGGFVRLSRAGLSIVEWDVFAGVAPPIGDAAWDEAFAAYQQTPEYQIVNDGMSLAAFKEIFLIEWAHRLIARVAGLFVVVPLAWFMWKRVLTPRESLPYWGVAALFGAQGAVGWFMVASGLVDRPMVDHFRLTFHLLMALLLLAIVLWMVLGRTPLPDPSRGRPMEARTRTLAWVTMGALVVQLSYGGIVAGLRAGHVSNTWPLMAGELVPSNLLSTYEPWWRNLVEPLGAHWVHRWFAVVVAALAVTLAIRIRREGVGAPAAALASWLVGVVSTQVALGVVVVLLNVPKWFALAHQAVAVVLFALLVVVCHQARHSRTSLRRAEV